MSGEDGKRRPWILTTVLTITATILSALAVQGVQSVIATYKALHVKVADLDQTVTAAFAEMQEIDARSQANHDRSTRNEEARRGLERAQDLMSRAWWGQRPADVSDTGVQTLTLLDRLLGRGKTADSPATPGSRGQDPPSPLPATGDPAGLERVPQSPQQQLPPDVYRQQIEQKRK